MKVWNLNAGHDWKDTEVLGVYSTPEQAEQMAIKVRKYFHYDTVTVTEEVIDLVPPCVVEYETKSAKKESEEEGFKDELQKARQSLREFFEAI